MDAVSIDRKHFIAYPTNRVVGTIADADQARAAIDALLQAGFARENIDILHNKEDLQRLDPTGTAHGFLAQFHRTLIRTFNLEELKHLTQYVQALRAGLFVIMVLAKRRSLRISAADILHRYGADFVDFYRRWSCEDVPRRHRRRRKTFRACSHGRGTVAIPRRLPCCSMKMLNSSASMAAPGTTGRPYANGTRAGSSAT